MTCRTTRIGSGATSFARISSGLSDDQCLSLFHDLQREGQNFPAPNQEQVESLIRELRGQVTAASGLSDARRRSILARLDAAAALPMDGATYHASRNIVARAHASRAALDRWISDVARTSGRSEDEVRGQLAVEHAVAMEAGRASRAPREWRQRMMAHPDYAHLPLARASADAMYAVESDARTRQAAMTVPGTVESHTFSGNVREVHYYPVSGLAVVRTSRQNRFFRVRPDVYQAFLQNPDTAIVRWRRDPDLQWNDQEQIAQAQTMYRCASCGQFASAATGHTCPPRGSAADRAHAEAVALAAMTGRDTNIPAPRAPMTATPNSMAVANVTVASTNMHGAPADANVSVSMPAAADIRRVVDEDDIPTVQVNASVDVMGPGTSGIPMESYTVTGTVRVSRDTGPFEVDATDANGERSLGCSCAAYARNYHCPHVDAVANAIAGQVNDDLVPSAATRAAAEAELANELATPPVSPVVAVPTSSVQYASDPEAFQAVYAEAKEKWERGENPIEYRYEDALGPIAAKQYGDGGRTFGLEIEYVLPYDVDWQEVNAAIAQDLYAAGLTPVNYQEEYHATADEESGGYGDGYSHAQDRGWRFEEDGSVAGELISPIMYDTPEAWQNLEKAIAILKRHGAMVNRDVGSHIHISTGDYGTTVGNYNRLGNMIDSNEDVLMRLATNPFGRNTEHRSLQGNIYTTPVPFPAEGYRSVSDVAMRASGHSRHVNFEHADNGEDGRVEFRLWDGTLDPAVIQNNVRTSMALVEAAHTYTDHRSQPRERMGTHRAARGEARRLTGEQWRESTQGFREFVDQYFTEDEDKKAAIAQFAMTRWQKELSRGR